MSNNPEPKNHKKKILTLEDCPVRILIVDDRELDLDLTECIILENKNLGKIEIFKETNGYDAFALCKEMSFGFILLDVKMPKIDGFGTASLIRKTEANKNTPVIFLTSAYDDPAIQNMAYEIGASDFLAKPINPIVFKNKLDLFLKLSREKSVIDQARVSAIEALEVKNNFLAVISHEIRTPLNMICGMTDVLEETQSDQERFQCLHLLQSSTRHLQALIESLLDLTKIELKGFTVRMKPFSIRNLISSIEAGLKPIATHKEIDFRVSLDILLPDILVGDEIRICQIMNNLINNAIKFTEKGEVHLKLDWIKSEKTGQTCLLVTVSDTGRGMKSSDLEIIFEKFTQLDMSSTRNYGGMGLGLALVKSLVELMNGTITVESEPGSGSVFSVSIPAEAGRKGLKKEKKNRPVLLSESGPEKDKLKILLAEDDPSNVKIFTIYLKNYNCEVVVAENGKIAFEKFKDSRDFHLVVMDLYMPEWDGIKSTSEMRKYEKENNLPPVRIIGLTACKNIDETSMFKDAGCEHVMTKPLKKSDLIEFLSGVDSRKKVG